MNRVGTGSMTKMNVFVALVAVLMPRIAAADCITIQAALQAKSAAVVFSGTTTNITPNAASNWPSTIVMFDVDRVWKGSVAKRFVVYSFTRTPEPFIFHAGETYLVFAHARTEMERQDLTQSVGEPPTFVVG